VEEVHRQQPGRLRAQEVPPTGVAAAGRGSQARTGQDAPDGAGTDPVPQPEQLTLDAPVPPARVLAGHPHDQILHLVADRWAAGPVRVRPTPPDQPAVPRQQGGRGVTRRYSRTQRGSSRASADSTARSGQNRLALPT
jgi:hypothetical protein